MTWQTAFKRFSLLFLSTYTTVTVLSVVIAHVLMVWVPKSGAAERIVFPVTKGLEFADIHWKAILILLAFPFIAPYAKDLMRRIKKISGMEFESVPLEPIGIREKPQSAEDVR
jgi:hypothetical protein